MYSKRQKINIWKRIKSHFLFCTSISSIHGIPHTVRKNLNPFERLFWVLCVTWAASTSIALGLKALHHYQTRPTVISIERDHWDWNFTFPSATLCFDTLDSDKVDILITQLSLNQEESEEFKEFLNILGLGKLTLYKNMEKYFNKSLYFNVSLYANWVTSVQHTIGDNQFTQNFGNSQDFQQTFTEMGVCYTYNSQIAIYSTYDYWLSKSMEMLDAKPPIKVDRSISLPSAKLIDLSSGFRVYFHASNEVPDYYTKYYYLSSATASYFGLTVDSLWTSTEVKSLSIQQRRCRFPEESYLKHSPVYSQNLCKIEYKINLLLRSCNCTPYFYRRIGNEPICNPRGMYCIFQNLYLFRQLRNSSHIHNCVSNCDVDIIKLVYSEISSWFLGTNFDWCLQKYPDVRYKRSLIFSGSNLIVQIGGTAGLFLGSSVLSLVEIIFFVSLRLYWCVFKGRTLE